MAKFVFTLEPVLRQRRRVEDQRQKAFAQAMRKRVDLRGQLERMQGDISTSKRSLASGLTGRVDIDRVAAFARYSGQTTARAQLLMRELSVAERHIEKARGELLEATRARRALELLRDRQHERWLRRQRVLEDAQLDELATQRFTRSADNR